MASSVYENREFGWRDRLRQLVGREKPPAPLCEPLWLVIERGHARRLQMRGRISPPVSERRPEELPDTEWHWVGGEWRERWIEGRCPGVVATPPDEQA